MAQFSFLSRIQSYLIHHSYPHSQSQFKQSEPPCSILDAIHHAQSTCPPNPKKSPTVSPLHHRLLPNNTPFTSPLAPYFPIQQPPLTSPLPPHVFPFPSHPLATPLADSAPLQNSILVKNGARACNWRCAVPPIGLVSIRARPASQPWAPRWVVRCRGGRSGASRLGGRLRFR